MNLGLSQVVGNAAQWTPEVLGDVTTATSSQLSGWISGCRRG